MDLISAVATATLSTLEPLIEKGAKAASKLALDKAQDLLKFLKRKLKEDSDASEIVEHYEQKPGIYDDALRKILRQRLESNPILFNELKEFLESQGSKIEVDLDVGSGDEITGADIGTSKQSLDAKARIKVKKAKKVTGVKIERLE